MKDKERLIGKAGAAALLSAAAAFMVAGPVAAAPVFEDGIPSGWSCEGECGTLGADGDVSLAPSPPGGDQYGYVVTTGDSAFETVGALPGHELGGETDGSALTSTPFAADAGEELDFYFNYITSDGGGFADYAWARLMDSGGAEAAILFTARTVPEGSIVPGEGLPDPEATLDPEEVVTDPNATNWSPLGGSSGSCFSDGCGNTGWVNSNYIIQEAGDYMLQFGVTNWNDTAFQSGMAFDGITVGGEAVGPGPTPAPVPAPATLLLFGVGLLGLGWFGARRRPDRV